MESIMSNSPRVAMILAGCGVYDGSEIQEAVACIFALSAAGAETVFFAPDKVQAHVIDHTTGQPMEESRNVLVEAARIARGNITPLAGLDARDFDALVIPGGFGAAKNLCTFAFDGEKMTVEPDVDAAMRAFREAGKPIGMCCIAPVIAAKSLGSKEHPPSLTLGADSEAAESAVAMGASHQVRAVDQIAEDNTHNLITAPAYMYGDASPHEIQAGITKMIESVLQRVTAFSSKP